ncbi:MAG TPA: hypothetical protein VG387_04775 [Rhizomicrobium sp.]|jgi:hypothetical protein|nr:hypothetical protein [Rhizomicrobium sp.]
MKIAHDPNVPALRRDWLAARIVGTAGALLILAAVVLAAVALWVPKKTIAPQAPPAPSAARPAPSAAEVAQARRAEGTAICDSALAAAQKIGIVPGFAVRTSDDTAPAPQGRYTCTAKTDVSAYAVTFDLGCPKQGGNCVVVPYTITQDGANIYQRK